MVHREMVQRPSSDVIGELPDVERDGSLHEGKVIWMAMMCQSIIEADLDKYCDGNWIAEAKLDGSRIHYANGKIFTTDRFSFQPSRDVTWKFPELEHAKINAVLDGEMLAESGNFEDTGSRIHLQDKLLIRISSKKNPVIFWIFDIREIAGENVEHLPLYKRKELLKAISFDNPRFELVDYTKDIKNLWESVKAEQKEGIVLKRWDSPYENRRSYSWLKCKNWHEEIVLASKYEEMPNDKGITVYMDNDQRLAVLGSQSMNVRRAIDEQGTVKINIQYLTKAPSADGKGKIVYRFPSFRTLV